MREKIRITIGQYGDGHISDRDFEELFDLENGMQYGKPENQLNNFYKAVKMAINDNADFLILPELFMPNKYVYQHVSSISEKNRIIIIGGIEWTSLNQRQGSKIICNQAFITIPSCLEKNSVLPKDRATVIKTTKIHPANEEQFFLRSKGYEFQNGNKIYIFKSKKIGNWAVLICVDFLNLPMHVLLQGKIQTLFIIAYNKDVEGYLSTSDTLHRLLFCNVVVCNVGNYGGSHVFSPFRERHKRNAFQIKGNHIDSAVTVELPVKIIADEQKDIKRTDAKDKLIQKAPDYGKITIWTKQR